MQRDYTVKHFARFDIVPRFNLLKVYFGSGIQGACRLCRLAGPELSRRTGTVPAIGLPRHLNSYDWVGAFIRLAEQPAVEYHSHQPGIDTLYNPPKQQFTLRLRFVILQVTNLDVRQQLLGLLPPLPAPNNAAPLAVAVPVVLEIDTKFEHDGVLFVVRDVTANEVVCQVVEVYDNDELDNLDEVNLPLPLVQQAVAEYNT
jgi:hypothetical protein